MFSAARSDAGRHKPELALITEAGEMQDVVVLEWTFSPPDFFEEPDHIVREHYRMTIENGKVEVRVDPDIYDKQHSMRDKLQEALNARFLAVQLLTHNPYKLSQASMYRLHPDGRKDVTVFPAGCAVTASVGTVDVVVKDKHGNVISDSRKERVEKKKELANLVESHFPKDPLLRSVLGFYNAAVSHPENELVHLHDIRDALSGQFGGETAARTALGVSRKQWKRLGHLANKAPLKQGRHRGKSAGALRDATEAELKEARNIALSLVEGYLRYLEQRSG